MRWHRTAKSARFDHCYDPEDYEVPKRKKPLHISFLGGAETARADVQRICLEALPEAEAFFATANDLADLPAMFEAKRTRPFVRFGFDNYIQEPMAYAFTLAKLGDERRARYWLSVAEHHDLDAAEERKLVKALNIALRSGG
jgi:hypothetical protein